MFSGSLSRIASPGLCAASSTLTQAIYYNKGTIIIEEESLYEKEEILLASN